MVAIYKNFAWWQWKLCKQFVVAIQIFGDFVDIIIINKLNKTETKQLKSSADSKEKHWTWHAECRLRWRSIVSSEASPQKSKIGQCAKRKHFGVECVNEKLQVCNNPTSNEHIMMTNYPYPPLQQYYNKWWAIYYCWLAYHPFTEQLNVQMCKGRNISKILCVHGTKGMSSCCQVSIDDERKMLPTINGTYDPNMQTWFGSVCWQFYPCHGCPRCRKKSIEVAVVALNSNSKSSQNKALKSSTLIASSHPRTSHKYRSSLWGDCIATDTLKH